MTTSRPAPPGQPGGAAGMVERYAEMRSEIAAIKASVTSADRTVTVVAGPAGAVLDVQLSEQALQASSARSLSASIMSTLRLAIADGARQQAEVVQRYVGDRLNIRDRVLATQQELLGDKIEAGAEEERRLAAERERDQGDSVLEDGGPHQGAAQHGGPQHGGPQHGGPHFSAPQRAEAHFAPPQQAAPAPHFGGAQHPQFGAAQHPPARQAPRARPDVQDDDYDPFAGNRGGESW